MTSTTIHPNLNGIKIGLPVEPEQHPDHERYDLKNAVSDNRLIGLWRIAAGYRQMYMIGFVALIISATAKMFTYLLIQYLVDEVLGKSAGTATMFVLLASGFVGLAVIEGSLNAIAGTLAARTAEKTVQRLRNYVFDHLQRMTFSYHDVNKTGDLIQRASSDMDAVRRFYADQAISVGRIILPFVVNIIALLALNPRLALFSLIIVPFMLVLSWYFGGKIEKSYEHVQNQDGVISAMLQENLSGVRVVKAFARQQYEMDKFDKENYEKFVRGRKLIRWHATYWPTSDVLAWTQLLLGFALAGILAINKEITPGTYLAYTGILVQIVWPLRNLGRVLVEGTTGLVSYNRIADILRNPREDLTSGAVQPDGNLRGDVVFDDVTFAYNAEKPVLQNISFHARAGEVIALIGSTGSGKTSLVNLLPRFYEYTSGSIKLDGVELKDYPRGYVRTQIGVFEQEPFLFSRTIRENITYSVNRAATDDEVIAAAKAAAVHDAIMAFPEGYNTLVGEKGVTLSGGQKQRVALARILLKNPRILILDDATSSVDTETEGAIRDALATLMTDRTTFIIAHRIQSVMIADQILVLDAGRIVQRGTHETLMAQDGFYRQIFALQSRIEDELEQEIASVGL